MNNIRLYRDYINESISERTFEEEVKSNQGRQSVETPLLYVDIKHGERAITRMSIFEGDDIREVTSVFAKKHNISNEVQQKLVDYVAS